VQFRDDMGSEIGSQVCHIIGSDGGTMPDAMNHRMPPGGLLTDVAYRWDIICDFSKYKKSVSSHLTVAPRVFLHICAGCTALSSTTDMAAYLG
jgi:hypothetical protein